MTKRKGEDSIFLKIKNMTKRTGEPKLKKNKK